MYLSAHMQGACFISLSTLIIVEACPGLADFCQGVMLENNPRIDYILQSQSNFSLDGNESVVVVPDDWNTAEQIYFDE